MITFTEHQKHLLRTQMNLELFLSKTTMDNNKAATMSLSESKAEQSAMKLNLQGYL